ncbi:hypothetical protein [Henriciella aquimarina]|uniref:hypothetical protein n=1 Tax=Henriciella aquimarina TaxID=545261 RepID=UPI000A03C645|nr:hypothetical protein [Henriciella aquimarina]
MWKSLTGAAAAMIVCGAATAQSAPVKVVEGDLPGEAEFEALAGLEELEDRDVVLLDLDMLPLAWPGVTDSDGNFTTPQTCEFGMIEGVDEVSVPTGSNHLLMNVHLGDPQDHAANGLSCEYSPVSGGEAPQDWARMRLTGCYLVRSVSIPTARQLILSPLPASACGLHD